MVELVLLIICANSAPVLVRNVVGNRFSVPVDFGYRLSDGRPVFGRSKTWRGVAAAVATCALAAILMGHPMAIGALAGLLSMCGDLIASFTKRRLHYQPSARAPVLDSVPEALLPAVGLKASFALTWLEVALVVVLFALIVRFSSPVLYRLRIRRRPW